MAAEYFDLLIFGYTRINESTMNLFMTIPLGIPQMIYNFHPKLPVFDLFNEKWFRCWDFQPYDNGYLRVPTDKINYSRIMGLKSGELHERWSGKPDECNAYLSHINCFNRRGDGYNEGVHYLSVECQNHNDCVRHLGIISVKNQKIIKLTKDELDNEQNVKKYLYPENYHSWNGPDDIICCVKLDCDNNTCEWFLGYDQKYKQIKMHKIEENESWHFVIQLCDINGSDFEIINVDPACLDNV